MIISKKKSKLAVSMNPLHTAREGRDFTSKLVAMHLDEFPGIIPIGIG